MHYHELSVSYLAVVTATTCSVLFLGSILFVKRWHFSFDNSLVTHTLTDLNNLCIVYLWRNTAHNHHKMINITSNAHTLHATWFAADVYHLSW